MPVITIVEALLETAVSVGTKHTDVPRRLTVVIPDDVPGALVRELLGERLLLHFGTVVDVEVHPKPGPPQVRWVQFGARTVRKGA